MGVIKGALLGLVAALLFLAFLSMNLLLTLSSSLQYENVEKQAGALATNVLAEAGVTDAVKQNYPSILTYCMNNHSEYTLNYQDFSFEIPCSAVFQGENAVVSEAVKSTIHNIYYTRYDCEFINCFQKYSGTIPIFLVSEKAYYFFSDSSYFALIASAVLFVLVFFFVEKRANAFILSGILLAVTSLIFVKMDYIISLLSDKIIFQLLWVFFSQSYFIGIKTLIIGAGLLAFGILMDIFKIGVFFSRLASKAKMKLEQRIDEKIEKKASKEDNKKRKKSK